MSYSWVNKCRFHYVEKDNLSGISYVDFGVDFIITDDVQKPQCIVFSKVSVDDSMNPQFCKLASLRPTHVHDNHMSFQTNRAQFRAVRTLSISGFVSEDTWGLEVSCRFAFAIAKETA